MENQAIRRAARIADIPLWKIASAIGISEPTLTRWLRVPLEPEKEARIMEAINSLTKSETGSSSVTKEEAEAEGGE